jgi:hypothetical protein
MTRFSHSKRKRSASSLLLAAFVAISLTALADQNYSQQVFFENSLSPGKYFYSVGKASPPSRLRLLDGKLPVETASFVSDPNAPSLEWDSIPNGGWSIELHRRRGAHRASWKSALSPAICPPGAGAGNAFLSVPSALRPSTPLNPTPERTRLCAGSRRLDPSYRLHR